MSVESSEKEKGKGVEEEIGGEIKKSTEKVIVNPVGVDELSKEDMFEMLVSMRNDISKMKEKNTRAAEEEDVYDTVKDYLEVPSVFFCFSEQYNCHGDVRNGLENLPPLGFVKFKPIYRYKRPAGRGVDVISVSQVSLRSKTQTKWLRDHSLFGIKFFENIDDVKSGVDTTMAEKMQEQSARVSGMNDLQIIERAGAEGLHIHSDTSKLRRELVQSLAMKEIRKSSKNKEKFFKAERDDSGRIKQASIINDTDNIENGDY